ncbi:carbonic anhydrase [Saccharothrix sp. NPDC042600]|uniref:carbonic anhydrase n=1 Tax=Saccharothrix TaxID=2071 RepID=UPI0033E1B18B|nr:carbonic anhydrase [Saccharothrix mutabilis subsp. capreolus]
MREVIERTRTFAGRWQDRLAGFAQGQQPEVLFIACSDSRVVPSLITGAGPGELFEFRNAGGVVPPYTSTRPCAASATIEYAVRVLEVRDVVVCGHSHCGAVGAAVRGDDLSGLPAVGSWLHGNGIGRRHGGDTTDPALLGAVRRHVAEQVEHVTAHPEVASRLATGRIRVHGWCYEVHTGAVTALRDGRFEPL